MNGAGKLLVIGGIALTALGMLYGLYYAVFVEHQMLGQMGGALATAFVNAAGGNMPEAHAAVGAYSAGKYGYVRQVDVHSHCIGLAMLMIALGVVFDRVVFGERTRLWIAAALLLGSVMFPLGVILQTARQGGMLASALAVVGSMLVIVGLGTAALGFMRQGA